VTSFAVVGAGWRAEMFWRLAGGLEDVTCVGAVVRSPRELPVPVYTSLADCVARWLSLADQQKRNCTLGWGPNADGERGRWGAVAIGAFVLANGLPPERAAERGGQPAREVLERLTEMRRYEAPPGPGHPAGDGRSGPWERR